jgi:hypothetical protein
MKPMLAVLAVMAAALSGGIVHADHGPPPGAGYEARELYDQQHYAGQGWLRGQPRGAVSTAREPTAGNAKTQATKPARPGTTRPTSGHGDW